MHKKNNKALQFFLEFAQNEEVTMLKGIPLHIPLINWGKNLKCRNIIMDQYIKKSDNYIFYLVALRHQKQNKEKDKKKEKEENHKQKERKENDKKVAKSLIEFYVSIFDKEPNEKSIAACINNHTTFFVQIYNKSTEEFTKSIVAAITFFMIKKEKIYLSAGWV